MLTWLKKSTAGISSGAHKRRGGRRRDGGETVDCKPFVPVLALWEEDGLLEVAASQDGGGISF